MAKRLLSGIPLSTEVSECSLSGVGAAHTVRTGAGWRGGRAHIHTRYTSIVRRQSDSRAEYQLADILGAGHDVTADEVGIVCGKLCCGADGLAYHAVAESRGESLDLGDDGCGGIADLAVRHVCVGPNGVDVADRTSWIG